MGRGGATPSFFRSRKTTSYDISLNCELDQSHQETGGTYALGGTTEAWLNVTYNYGIHFRRVFGDGGIRQLDGKTALESLNWLLDGITKLGDDVDGDYWKATEGNAKRALTGLFNIATQAVKEGKGDSVWSVH